MRAPAVDRTRTPLGWQLPTLCLAAVVAGGLLAQDRASAPASTGCGLLLLAVLTVLAGVVPWARVPRLWQALVPVLSVVAVAMMEFRSVAVMPSVVLLAAVPVLWLALEFGRTGLALALASVGGLACVAYLGAASLPTSGAGWAQLVMAPAVAVGLCLAARHLADDLQDKHDAMKEQSALVETALELAHDRLLMVQAILDSVDAGIVGYDREGEVILENSTAHDLDTRIDTGAEGSKGSEGSDGPHYYFEDRTTRVPSDEHAGARARRGEEFSPQTYWFGPPEDQVAVMLSARQIHRHNGDRFGAVVVGWEVTDILEAVRVREEFLTTVSHELRTPLTSIIGYQELIAEELDPQDQQGQRISAMLSVAQRNAGVLLSRVSQLLQVSGADGPEIRPRPVDVSALLHDAVVKHRPVALSAGIHLATTVADGVGADLDPDAWEQVVDNLVSNALKYTPAGGRVDVCLEEDGDRFVLQVVDTGIGMSRAEQKRAFERFYRTTSARDSAIQGLGVGLSITQQIIEAHGGDVTLSSTPGRGTSVTARSPLRAARAAG
ncbi:sensor histidine kinase [Nocardioides dongkuii]|uniref:sensor histidine kinase n=1 Tax=Nocardioides dongkuii TaxID=2760089 RepID=UPI0015FC7B91|nr:HAMP domain-containing sensor histidine kinase [Nocardioides dongkuii]